LDVVADRKTLSTATYIDKSTSPNDAKLTLIPLPSTMSNKTALIFGATGQVGQQVLKELLASSEFTKVGEFGRRVTDTASLSTGKDKLVQKTIDFEKLEEAGLKDEKWDIVYITRVGLSICLNVLTDVRALG
jgi:hypothetical protein